MNIFYVDTDPVKAAQQLCNKHVIKMPVETANLLLWPFKDAGLKLPIKQDGTEVKLSHQNHPCSLFTKANRNNYDWVFTHFVSLIEEYNKRYKRQHECAKIIKYIERNISLVNFGKSQVPRSLCFGKYSREFFQDMSYVCAYRKYYWLDKNVFAKWPSKSTIPEWWYGGQTDQWIDKFFVDGNYVRR